MDSYNVEASRTWIAAYKAINLSNNILDALDVVDEEIKDQIHGEALFVEVSSILNWCACLQSPITMVTLRPTPASPST